MASKTALAAALLLALVAVASATTFTTTVITNSADEDDTNPRQQQQCRQMVQGRQFRHCQRFLEQRGSSPYGEEEEEEVIEMSTGVQHQQQHLQECCQQLREMDRRQCGCEAIKQAVRQAQEGGSSRRYQTGESEQIYQKARSLPRKCGLRQQQCSFRIVLV